MLSSKTSWHLMYFRTNLLKLARKIKGVAGALPLYLGVLEYRRPWQGRGARHDVTNKRMSSCRDRVHKTRTVDGVEVPGANRQGRGAMHVAAAKIRFGTKRPRPTVHFGPLHLVITPSRYLFAAVPCDARTTGNFRATPLPSCVADAWTYRVQYRGIGRFINGVHGAAVCDVSGRNFRTICGH